KELKQQLQAAGKIWLVTPHLVGGVRPSQVSPPLGGGVRPSGREGVHGRSPTRNPSVGLRPTPPRQAGRRLQILKSLPHLGSPAVSSLSPTWGGVRPSGREGVRARSPRPEPPFA